MSVRPIKLQQAFHTTWFTVEGQIDERRVDVIYSSAPMNVERWSPFKNEKLLEAVRLFPCLWQVNTKSYKDAVAKAKENSHVAGVGKKFALSRTSFASSAFCSVETKPKKQCFLVFFITGAIHLLLHLF